MCMFGALFIYFSYYCLFFCRQLFLYDFSYSSYSYSSCPVHESDQCIGLFSIIEEVRTELLGITYDDQSTNSVFTAASSHG